MADKNLEAELFGDSDDEDDPFEGLPAPQPAEADAEAAEEPEEDTRPASPPADLPRCMCLQACTHHDAEQRSELLRSHCAQAVQHC